MAVGFGVGVVGVGGAGRAGAAVVEIVADRDGTLFEDPSGSTANGSGQHLFAGLTAMGFARRALVRFDVAGSVPAGATVTGATLRLHMSRGVSGLAPIFVHRVTAAWGEGASVAPGEEGGGIDAEIGDATWTQRFYAGAGAPPVSPWATPGGDFDGTPSAFALVGGIGTYDWPSTAAMVADAQGMLDAPAGNFGWIVLASETDPPPTSKRFDSRENETAAYRPTLVVEYAVPSPGGGVAGVTLAGVLGARRRRRGR
jgi:hypothetical protein